MAVMATHHAQMLLWEIGILGIWRQWRLGKVLLIVKRVNKYCCYESVNQINEKSAVLSE